MGQKKGPTGIHLSNQPFTASERAGILLYKKMCLSSYIYQNVFRKIVNLLKKPQMSKILKNVKMKNLENLGYAKIKGARNGSDARKLEARKFKGIR